MAVWSVWLNVGIAAGWLAIVGMAAFGFHWRRSRAVVRGLVEAEASYRSLFECSADGLYQTLPDGGILRANTAFARLLGFESAEALAVADLNVGSGLYVIEHRRREFMEAVAAHGKVEDFESQILRHDGAVIWVSESTHAVRDGRSRLVCFEGKMTDITSRKRAEERLRLAATVFETASEAIIVTDAHRRILQANSAFTTTTGFRVDEVVGQTPRILSSGRHEPGFYEAMESMLSTTGHWQGEVWNRRKNGELYVEWLSFAAVRDIDDRIVNFVGVFSDIARRKQDEGRVHHQANYDALTQLPDRWLFQARLGQAIERCRASGRKLALLCVNVNQFKFVNDSLGHRAGDDLLKELARRLLDAVRYDDTVARLGGDEFAVIVENFRDDEPIERLPERLLHAIADPFRLDGGELVVGISIGIALYPGDGTDAEALVRNAATAMGHAKEQQSSAFRFFDGGMETRALERLKLELRLRRALEKGEFEVHYQPQVDISSRSLVGAEALIRWTDQELGPVSPSIFIPVAEASGLIVAIGQWVLREVCRQIVAWKADGHSVPRIAVNLSFLQFRRPDFLDNVRTILSEGGIDGSQLEFELTESIVMHDADHAISILSALRELGIELAIDDFGTGYSSLNRLKRMPIQTLKIDRCFINDVTNGSDGAAIVSAMISMAHALNLKVVAEGVETEAQLAFLDGKSCDSAQGFLLSRPIAPERFARLMADWRAARNAAAD
ncbi:MAG: EAL domain-containing protein [Alphaproteobacteria bacterium]|nr:EAL domain-containing protein [Alphaproteobacteria bacterium]